MLGIMGNVDQQINDKADSMQMQGKTSTVSKDLLDVMATQKIAREKDAALKELQMAQQTNPNTIKDQLEQKVMGMTQSEMTNQTGGILAQRAQQQKRPPQSTPMMGKNPSLAMNRGAPQGGIAGARPPMGGAPKPPMGGMPRPPMGGMPRPPMGGLPAVGGAPRPMMASGGIVGYLSGGLVKQVKEIAAREGGKLTPETMRSLVQIHGGEMAKYLTDNYGFKPSRADMSDKERTAANREALAAPFKAIGSGIEGSMKKDTIEKAKRLGVTAEDLGQVDTSGMGRAMDMLKPKEEPEENPFYPTPTGAKPELPKPQAGPQTGTATTQAGPQAAPKVPGIAGTLDPSAITAAGKTAMGGNPVSERMGELVNKEADAKGEGGFNVMDNLRDMASVDPKAERTAEQTRLEGLQGLTGKDSIQNKLKTANKEITDAQRAYDDPAAQRRRDREGFRRAGVGGMRQVQQSRDELAIKRARRAKEDMLADEKVIMDRVDKVAAGSSQMFRDMVAQRAAAMGSVESLATNDVNARLGAARIAGDLEGKVQSSILKAMEIGSTQELNKLIMQTKTETELMNIWSRYYGQLQEQAANYLTQLVPNAQEIMARGNVEEITQLESLKQLIQGVMFTDTGSINQMFVDKMKEIAPQLAGMGFGSLTGGMPNTSNSNVMQSGLGNFKLPAATQGDFAKYGQQ